MKRNKAFTLLELLVVVAALLLPVVSKTFRKIRRKSEVAQGLAQVRVDLVETAKRGLGRKV